MKTGKFLSKMIADTTIYRRFVLTVLTLVAAAQLSAVRAQCGIANTAFSSGEELSYNLYFNWKFVWMKVGSASMKTTRASYGGKPAWKASLVTRGNNRLDGVFVMRDTLLSYCNDELAPVYFRKGAREGKRYYVDELWYTYPGGSRCHIDRHRLTHHGDHRRSSVTYDDCIYDMMSIFLRARNFDATGMKKGDVIPMPVSDAKKLSNSWLTFRGKETFKVSGTGEKFRCLVFSFIERENGKNHELIRFFITDDQNHIPVRLDMHLSFGSAKAYLDTYKGIRNEMTSLIQK